MKPYLFLLNLDDRKITMRLVSRLIFVLEVILLNLMSGCLLLAEVTNVCKHQKKLDSANAYIQRGQTCFKLEYWYRATKDFDRAIEIQPDNYVAYYLRGSVYMLQNAVKNHYEKAISDYNRAIQLQPNHTTSYVKLGKAYYMIGEYEKAIASYTKALQLEPSEVVVIGRGRLTSTLGQVQIDDSNCNQALTCRGTNRYSDAVIYYLRGSTYLRMRNFDGAIEDYTQAIQIDPNFSSAYRDRGFSYLANNNINSAIQDFEIVKDERLLQELKGKKLFGDECLLIKPSQREQNEKVSSENTSTATKLAGHSGSVNLLAVSSNGRTLASSSSDNTIKLWNIADGKLLHTLSSAASSMTFIKNGNILASLSNKKIKLWNVADGKLLSSFDDYQNTYALALSPDGRTLASAGDRGSRLGNIIKLWDLCDGKLSFALYGHSHSVGSLTFSPDGRTLVSTSGFEKSIKLWNVADGKLLSTIKGHGTRTHSLAVSPNDRILAGSHDYTIKLWNVAEGTLLSTPSYPTYPIRPSTGTTYSLAFSPDGRILAGGGKYKTVKLWNVADGRLLSTFEGHSQSVRSIAFTHDGKIVISGSDDGIIRFWQVP